LAELPSVVLIGDSIRLGYEPFVAETLSGRADVTGPPENCGTSARLLEHLDRWTARSQPSLVHFNCGLHDIRRVRASGRYNVSAERYEANLREIVERLRQQTAAQLVFATTTPIVDERHAGRGLAFDRLEADVQRYNRVAVGVMSELGVPVNDLHALVLANEAEELLQPDGTHFVPAGYAVLGEGVAAAIERQLSTRLTPPGLPR
jgi:lysophospholipase L1-like esterase